jgi:hypothetical protein
LQGHSVSPKAASHHRKSRPAPLPPVAIQEKAALSFSEAKLVVVKSEDSLSHSEWEREKNKKDVTNRNRQSQTSNTITSGKCNTEGNIVSVYKYRALEVQRDM